MVPAFGETVTMRIKNHPSDSFAPRGRDATFLGCVSHVRSGVLVGQWGGEGWNLEINSTYVAHGEVVGDQEEANQEELQRDAVEAAGGDGVPKLAAGAIIDYATQETT